MKTALAFSGGKDSFACLFLNRDKLHEITVFWVNTGKVYPETLQMIEFAKTMCPNFVEILSDREGQNARKGIPSDVVPVNYTDLGFVMTGQKSVMIQDYLGCCFENIGRKLHDAAREHGITHMIRGQRTDESHKSPARNGSVVDGIIYIQPIEDWTREEVIQYLVKHMDVPDHFSIGHSSLDCYDCTAYSRESQDRVEFTRQKYPLFYMQYASRMTLLKTAINSELSYGG